MFAYFRDTLEKYQRNFVILKGTAEERKDRAIELIDNLLKR
jgi:hypothetical protein